MNPFYSQQQASAGGNFGNPFGGMMNMMQQFNQFKQNFQGDPKERVQQLLNSGQMTQQQFNQLSQMAQQFQMFIH